MIQIAALLCPDWYLPGMPQQTPAPQRPLEFRYWERIDEPWVRRLRAVLRRTTGFDPAPPEEVVRTFASMYYDADPLAEAFVDEVYLGRSPDEGRALLDQAITSGVDSIEDPPASLVELFADIEEDPDWVDHRLVDLGARVFRRYGTSVFRFAGTITLAAYAENSVAKPLILSGAYTGASTRNRFAETAAFWIDVSEPGGMSPGEPGRAAALRVRIMHVFVRRRLLAHPEWDLEAWGVPISQADALLTLMGGSAAPGLAMQAMGYRPTGEEIRAMMHFWRYIGHIMGVRPRWYPKDLREAIQLAFMTQLKGARGAGEDGRRLCQAYVTAFAPQPDPTGSLLGRLTAAWENGVHLGYARFFLPGPMYRDFGLPSVGLFALHPLVQAPFRFAAETLRRNVPALDDIADRRARASRRRWVDRQLGTKAAAFDAPRKFTR
ncbi:MAG: DUF2236 domain-containing protein [Deltaproteobacteria bacterium]|nr:MAG: DUF2236 domain-containing protein [Deltaproteobacteria bacterium]